VTLRLLTASVLVSLAAILLTGWFRLARRSVARSFRPPALRRAALATAAVLVASVALLSPLDDLAHGLLLAHMVQHLLLMMVATPLALLADPLPLLLWGLPRRLRRAAGRLLRSGSLLRRCGARILAMPSAWTLAVATLALWHVPALHQRALSSDAVHLAQHLSFVAGAAVFWWPVLSPAPRWRPAPGDGARLVYLVSATFPGAALGLLLMLSPSVLYPAYAVDPRVWGLDAIEDQAWAGFAMWAGGGAVDMLGAAAVAWRFLAAHDTGSGAASLTVLRPRARMNRFGA
jgi:cytochrome c oxidase assembly factor CtaG